MIKDIVLYLEDLNFVSIILRLTMAVIFGGIIGYGRERERRPAGLRTHTSIYWSNSCDDNKYLYV